MVMTNISYFFFLKLLFFYLLQLFLEAYDSKHPDDKSYASVTINILKNTNPPVIVPSTLSATVNDYDPPGTFVVDVNATDADATVSI